MRPDDAELDLFVRRARSRWPSFPGPDATKSSSFGGATLHASWRHPWGEFSISFTVRGGGFKPRADWFFRLINDYCVGGEDAGADAVPAWALEFLFWVLPDREDALRRVVPTRPLIPLRRLISESDAPSNLYGYEERLSAWYQTLRGGPAEWEAALRLGGYEAFVAAAGASPPEDGV